MVSLRNLGGQLDVWSKYGCTSGRTPYGIPVDVITGRAGWAAATIKPIVGQPPPMTLLLVLFALVLVVGLCVILHAVHSAPEGYEDEKGFHATSEPEATLQTCRVKI